MPSVASVRTVRTYWEKEEEVRADLRSDQIVEILEAKERDVEAY